MKKTQNKTKRVQWRLLLLQETCYWIFLQNFELSYGHFIQLASWQYSPPGLSPGRIETAALTSTPTPEQTTTTTTTKLDPVATCDLSLRFTSPSCSSSHCSCNHCTLRSFQQSDHGQSAVRHSAMADTPSSFSNLSFKTFLVFYCLTSTMFYSKPDNLFIGITNKAWICLDQVGYFRDHS